MRSRAQHKHFVTGGGRNSIRKNSNVKEVVECLSFIYMLILYHPRVYNMFHPMVPPHGPTLRSHPRVPSQGPTLGSRVLGPTPGSRSHFSGMPSWLEKIRKIQRKAFWAIHSATREFLPKDYKRIVGRLSTRQLKGAEKLARCPESNLIYWKKS